jgi:hypothetical protein
MVRGGKKRRADPIPPSRFGGEEEPWSRWAGDLQLLTALLHRRRLRIPGPPIFPVLVIAAVFGGLLGLLWWLVALLLDHPGTLLNLLSWLVAALAGRTSS